MTKDSLYNLTLESFPYDEAKIMGKGVYKKLNFNPDTWEHAPRVVREKAKEYDLSLLKVLWQGLSKDGTRKFLLGLKDKNSIEAVLIESENDKRLRSTLCISSQVGCAIGCPFCHTATQGLTRHLTTAEIVGQYLTVSSWMRENVDKDYQISNIVFMGQGEPLHNFENVKKACYLLTDPLGIALSKHKVTISTSGLVPKIKQWEELPDVNVAISLHAIRNNLRSELMPINKRYQVDGLLEALKTIPVKNSRRIMYEYLLIKDLNDTQEDIDGLIENRPKKESKINIIPFNEYPESKFKRPSDEHIEWFQRSLQAAGLTCTVRETKGDDILAACGQLKTQYEKLNLPNSN